MFFSSFCHYLWFLHGSTLEYLGVLLLFCVFECRVPGSTWENLGVLGSTWDYLGVPQSTTLVSPQLTLSIRFTKNLPQCVLCLRVINFDRNLWWHKWHLNFITQILAFFKEIKTIFKNQQISAHLHFILEVPQQPVWQRKRKLEFS